MLANRAGLASVMARPSRQDTAFASLVPRNPLPLVRQFGHKARKPAESMMPQPSISFVSHDEH